MALTDAGTTISPVVLGDLPGYEHCGRDQPENTWRIAL
jgi:hypothetical protein